MDITKEWMWMPESDSAFILGRQGKTRWKISLVSGCRIDVKTQESMVELTGTAEERRRARKYIDMIRVQRVGSVHIDESKHDDHDLTIVAIPHDCVGFVTGANGAYLRICEQEWRSLMFFCDYHHKKGKGKGSPNAGERREERLAIFGHRRGRLGARLKVMSAIEAKIPGYFTRNQRAKYLTGESVLTVDSRRVDHQAGLLDSDRNFVPVFCQSDFGIDTIWLAPTELSWSLGQNGSTRRKVAAASNCILEYVGNVAHMGGYKRERRVCRDYLLLLLTQRQNTITKEVLENCYYRASDFTKRKLQSSPNDDAKRSKIERVSGNDHFPARTNDRGSDPSQMIESQEEYSGSFAEYVDEWAADRDDIDVMHLYSKIVCGTNNLFSPGHLRQVEEQTCTYLFLDAVPHKAACLFICGTFRQNRQRAIDRLWGAMKEASVEHDLISYTSWNGSDETSSLSHPPTAGRLCKIKAPFKPVPKDLTTAERDLMIGAQSESGSPSDTCEEAENIQNLIDNYFGRENSVKRLPGARFTETAFVPPVQNQQENWEKQVGFSAGQGYREGGLPLSHRGTGVQPVISPRNLLPELNDKNDNESPDNEIEMWQLPLDTPHPFVQPGPGGEDPVVESIENANLGIRLSVLTGKIRIEGEHGQVYDAWRKLNHFAAKFEELHVELETDRVIILKN